jgi:hypothetical protein
MLTDAGLSIQRPLTWFLVLGSCGGRRDDDDDDGNE